MMKLLQIFVMVNKVLENVQSSLKPELIANRDSFIYVYLLAMLNINIGHCNNICMTENKENHKRSPFKKVLAQYSLLLETVSFIYVVLLV